MAEVTEHQQQKTFRVTREEVTQAKILADSLLDDVLSNLHDMDRTCQGIAMILHLCVRCPITGRFSSAFFKKIRQDPRYLNICTSFQKRILLFNIVECLVAAKNLELEFTPDELSPLETVLKRLGDVAIAFEDVLKTKTDEFINNIWLQTVKQTVFLFLKNDQTVKASETIVISRESIYPHQRQLLEKLIKRCRSNPSAILDKLQEKGHDYESYYVSMCDFIKGLNDKIERTMLKNFSERITSTVVLSDHMSDNGTNSGVQSDVPESPTSEHNSSYSDEDDLSDHVNPDEESDLGSAVTIPDADEEIEKEQSKSEDDDYMSPKHSLKYRLKNQFYGSGIMIPCKQIVDHCRQVHGEEETTETPSTTSSRFIFPKSRKPGLKKVERHRNYLLGDRFEDLNHSVSSRSYSSRKKTIFSLDLDSYIVVGCRRLGIGQWAKIAKAFPFPSECTNTKIKDRFRTLIKCNYIAILDDGDFNVLKPELKAKLPDAERILRNYSAGKKRSNTIETFAKPVISRGVLRGGNNARRKATSADDEEESDIDDDRVPDDFMTIDSDEENAEPVIIKQFFVNEDAYLVCGMNMGMKWSAMKERFKFRPHITERHMMNRWESMLRIGDVERQGDKSYVCNNTQLQKEYKKATEIFKNDVQRRRKGMLEHDPLEDDLSSRSPAPLRVKKSARKKRGRKLDITSSDGTEIDEVEREVSMSSKSKSKKSTTKPLTKPVLNASIDAGTQTMKPKIPLRQQSPSMLDADSSSSSVSSDDKSEKLAGSPIRPSMINLFKKKTKKRRDSITMRIREKRKREIMRQQRKKPAAQKRQWSKAETEKFLELLEVHGPGKWSDILDGGYDVFKGRSSVMIKDKFRNMMKHNQIPENMVTLWKARKASNE